MNLLFVASECAPFVKTGGLADVIGALPKALASVGVRVRVLIPAYPPLAGIAAAGSPVARFGDLLGGGAEVRAARACGADLLLLAAPHLFDRAGGVYLGPDGRDWPDNHLRFAALSLAGAEIGLDGVDGWKPDVVNVHDWQAGLLPAYLAQSARSAPPVVMTIHNVAFQGLFDAAHLPDLGLEPGMFTADGIEYYGKISFLKAGIALSDRITTVSPSYARELLTPECGMGMEGVLAARRGDISGILNGIDLEVWNPETDPHLLRTYSARAPRGKAANRPGIEARFGLARGDGPLFCAVSRLTSQKGVDLLLQCLPDLVAEGASLAILGAGDRQTERQLAAAADLHPGRVGLIAGHDEPLAHLLQGGSDAILVPSRFEPCGLTQLCGLRYGTLPVVARTGGLADTVIDANEAALAAGCATGIQFAPRDAAALGQAIARACALHRRPKAWAGMMRRAMRHPVGWEASATAYREIYASLAGK